MPISRLVADSFNRLLSVLSITFDKTGNVVLRLAMARLTMLNPLARLSCKQETFINGPPVLQKAVVAPLWGVCLD
jgi:hypothetical protein